MAYYLTFDAGTQSVKVAIYDENMHCITTHSKQTTLNCPHPGWVEMNADEYLDNIKICIKHCLSAMHAKQLDPAQIQAIVGDGIICGIVGIDANAKAITPYINYLDSRTQQDAEYLNAKKLSIWGEQTGNPEPLCMFPALHARWLLNNNTAFQKAGAKFVHNAPYILMNMAGLSAAEAFIDWGSMSGWGLGYDVYKKKWSAEQLEILQLDKAYLPKIVKPWDIIGKLSPEFAVEVGLPAGIAICAGAGDTMQSMLGCGIFEAGRAVDVAGTCAMFCVSTKCIIPELSKPGNGLIFNSGTVENTYFYWGFVRTGGLALRWFKDSICKQAGNDDYYQVLSETAQHIAPGCNEVIFLPYLTGEYSNADVKGCFINMTLDTDQATLWRSVLEAIAYDYKKVTDIYRRAGIAINTITITEGGSRDKLWNQIKADVLESSTQTYKTSGGALAMNAITAAYALGKVQSLKNQVQEWLQPLDTFTPNQENTIVYHEHALKQKHMLRKLQG